MEIRVHERYGVGGVSAGGWVAAQCVFERRTPSAHTKYKFPFQKPTVRGEIPGLVNARITRLFITGEINLWDVLSHVQ